MCFVCIFCLQIEKEKKEADRRAYFDAEKAEEERAAGNECFKKGKFPEALKHYNEGILRTADDAKVSLSNSSFYYPYCCRKRYRNFTPIELVLT